MTQSKLTSRRYIVNLAHGQTLDMFLKWARSDNEVILHRDRGKSPPVPPVPVAVLISYEKYQRLTRRAKKKATGVESEA